MNLNIITNLYNPLLLLLFYVWLTYSLCHATSGITNTNILCVESEREALLQFKHGIRVDHCGLLHSWGGSQDCCLWGGIHCNNHSGHVISLHLPGYGISVEHAELYGYSDKPCLEGTLGISLFELKHLKYLNLSYNNFHGQTIPKFIGSLANLEHLDLSNAWFSGIVPQELGNLSSLSSLKLNNVDSWLKMRVESLGWLSQLRFLKEVNLGGIDLSVTANSWLSVVSSLPFLQKLQFDSCKLSLKSPFSISYINSSSNLRVINLAFNKLNDTSIFEWLFNLNGLDTNLVSLDLSYNDQMFGNSLQLSELAVKFLSNLCNLQTLELPSTNLKYDFSDIIQSFSACVHKSLMSLDLSENKVWGSIPDNIGALYHLRYLSVDGNELNGTISEMLGQLYSLETLSLESNSLKGVLTSTHFSRLSKLNFWSLRNNTELVVNISANWIPPFQLRGLDLSSCKVGPYFPKWLLTQNNLEGLDVSNVGISDIIPVSFWNSSLLSRINFLSMSHNMIYGTIPNVFITFNRGTLIDLSFNNLKGAIPSFLGNNVSELFLNNNKFSKGFVSLLCLKMKKNLQYLSLSNNLFSEELPHCLGYFSQLVTLNLENNNLIGNLPTSIGALNQLVTLDLSNNKLSGELPTSLLNCSSLVFLDLSNNSLNGYIPPNFGYSYKSLSILNLQNNQLFGSLPSSLCHLSNLQLLDLSKNHISGNIPSCIYRLKGMANTDNNVTFKLDTALSSYTTDNSDISDEQIMWKREQHIFFGDTSLGLLRGIDLSNNKLKGQIPEGISNLIGLKFLNLSRNNLSGAIMSRIGQLTSLESLDFSHNRLSGEIPSSLTHISALSVLDFSYNNLSGKIPDGTQLQSFDATAYMGNPGLCGAPLQKCDGDEAPTTIPQTVDNEHTTNDFYLGLCISVVFGFIIGFWGVCGTLVLKRSWRHAFFRFYEDGRDKIYVMVVVSTARVWRRS